MDIKELEKDLQVDDTHIVLKRPHVYTRHDRRIVVRQINYYYDWENFCYYLGIFFKYYYLICENSKLPDRLSDIEEFRNNISLAVGSNKKILKYLINICKYVQIYDKKKNVWKEKKSWKVRWMKKHFTIDDWIELFCKIYLYNIKGVKKNLYEGLLLLSSHQLN